MPHYIFSGMNETVRLDPKETPSHVLGLGTTSLKTCAAVILIGKTSKRISLTHFHISSNPTAILLEAAWVGSPFEIILVKNQAEVEACIKHYNLVGNGHDTEKNLITFLKSQEWLKHIKRRLDTKTTSVFVDRTGEVSTWVTEDKKIVFSPDRYLREAIQLINSMHHPEGINPTLEFDGKQFTPANEINKQALISITAIHVRMKKLKLDITEDNILSIALTLDKLMKNAGSKNGLGLDTFIAYPEIKDKYLKNIYTILTTGKVKFINFDEATVKLCESELPSSRLRI